MAYARIQDGTVVDVRSTPPKGCYTDNIVAEFVTVPDDVGNGWTFDGSVYTPPPAPYIPTQAELDAIAAAEAERIRISKVPRMVTRRQARQALLLRDKLALVQTAIDAIPDATQRGLMQIEWDDSLSFDRDRPSLIAIGTAIGYDSLGLDDVFTFAATL